MSKCSIFAFIGLIFVSMERVHALRWGVSDDSFYHFSGESLYRQLDVWFHTLLGDEVCPIANLVMPMVGPGKPRTGDDWNDFGYPALPEEIRQWLFRLGIVDSLRDVPEFTSDVLIFYTFHHCPPAGMDGNLRYALRCERALDFWIDESSEVAVKLIPLWDNFTNTQSVNCLEFALKADLGSAPQGVVSQSLPCGFFRRKLTTVSVCEESGSSLGEILLRRDASLPSGFATLIFMPSMEKTLIMIDVIESANYPFRFKNSNQEAQVQELLGYRGRFLAADNPHNIKKMEDEWADCLKACQYDKELVWSMFNGKILSFLKCIVPKIERREIFPEMQCFRDSKGPYGLGQSALCLAARVGHEEYVRRLLEAGADYKSETARCNGFLPVHLAAMNGHAKVVELFLEKAPWLAVEWIQKSQNIYQSFGGIFVLTGESSYDALIPLHVAVCYKQNVRQIAVATTHKEVVKILLSIQDVDVLKQQLAARRMTADNYHGMTPLHLAALVEEEEGKNSMLELILQKLSHVGYDKQGIRQMLENLPSFNGKSTEQRYQQWKNSITPAAWKCLTAHEILESH